MPASPWVALLRVSAGHTAGLRRGCWGVRIQPGAHLSLLATLADSSDFLVVPRISSPFFFFFFFFFFFGVLPAACGSSQARGLTRATAASPYHCHSHARSKPLCDLHRSSQQCQILNPLKEARDRTHVLMDTSWIHFAAPQRELQISSPFEVHQRDHETQLDAVCISS